MWDLRQFGDGVPVAIFKHHSGPITSVEWHPTDSTVFAASGEDHQITLWDLSVEKDDEQENVTSASGSTLPPQLLFIHMVCTVCLLKVSFESLRINSRFSFIKPFIHLLLELVQSKNIVLSHILKSRLLTSLMVILQLSQQIIQS